MDAVDNLDDVMTLYAVALRVECGSKLILSSLRHSSVLHRLHLAHHRQHLEALLL